MNVAVRGEKNKLFSEVQPGRDNESDVSQPTLDRVGLALLS